MPGGVTFSPDFSRVETQRLSCRSWERRSDLGLKP